VGEVKGGRGGGDKSGGRGKGREMTQTLYAHMNIIKKKKKNRCLVIYLLGNLLTSFLMLSRSV
jgi:hypothetical protein